MKAQINASSNSRPYSRNVILDSAQGARAIIATLLSTIVICHVELALSLDHINFQILEGARAAQWVSALIWRTNGLGSNLAKCGRSSGCLSEARRFHVSFDTAFLRP